ncbi:hypothetical protein NLX83_01690 [Allokutzneria sp. A3M-2-11 16]|uniref:Cap15 family cyclic dinucleotide receptor domain-containing protein n=1 Tax=Allokutzneria sp. A3M-2-11 16 TaxID=2962043 RepID=UPI0020B81BFC|nr:hypothetical protein [Allokutzneria sp. A3M-2-11 16]MCP3797961.1 hypothetical protein [Allokutzneria sp. A3M-2-11 16]
MKWNVLTRVVIGVAVLVFFVGTWLQGGKPDFGWLKFFSAAVLAATVLLTVWDLWLWRTRIAQIIPGVPRSLRGTWRGTLTSFWVNPETGERVPPKTVYLVVRQRITRISVTLLTNESRSTSSLAELSEVDGICELVYLYINRPEARFEHRSRMHHGSTVLSVSGSPAKRLKGKYWTDRDSKGELDFAEWNKTLVDDFEEGVTLFRPETKT